MNPARAFVLVLLFGAAFSASSAAAEPLPPPKAPPPGSVPPSAPTPSTPPPSPPPSSASAPPAHGSASSAPATIDAGLGSSLVPIRVVARPLTLPIGVARLDLALAYQHGGPGVWTLPIGAGYGITDDFEIDATFLPLVLSPVFEYGNPQLSGTYRLIRGETLEAGGFLGLTLYTHDTRLSGALRITPGVPVLVHVGDRARLDTGVFVPVTFGADRGTVLGAFVPLRLTFQVSDPLYAGVGTGLGFQDASHFGDTIYAPLNAFVGYAIAFGCSALVDFHASLGFPNLYLSGVHGGIETDDWQAMAGAAIYVPAGPVRCAK